MKQVSVEIGDVPVSVVLVDDSFQLDGSYRNFTCSPSRAECEWQVLSGPVPARFQEPIPSDDTRRWEISCRWGEKVFRLWNHSQKDRLWKTASVKLDFSRGDIWVNRKKPDTDCVPLFFIDLLLWSHLLLDRGGLIIHAAAVQSKNSVYLFPGPAGSGKSTWSRMISHLPDVMVLAEDKVVLRKNENIFMVFGTPWNPSPESRVANGGRLESIFFLQPSSRNRITELSLTDSFRRLLQSSFLPFSYEKDLSPALSLIEDLVRGIPARLFEFKPNVSAVDLWRSFSDA